MPLLPSLHTWRTAPRSTFKGSNRTRPRLRDHKVEAGPPKGGLPSGPWGRHESPFALLSPPSVGLPGHGMELGLPEKTMTKALEGLQVWGESGSMAPLVWSWEFSRRELSRPPRTPALLLPLSPCTHLPGDPVPQLRLAASSLPFRTGTPTGDLQLLPRQLSPHQWDLSRVHRRVLPLSGQSPGTQGQLLPRAAT